MLKKVAGLVSLFLIVCTSFVFAAPQPIKHIVLFYKVTDAILECQNSNEDKIKGAAEFENELKNHYGNRFIVDAVKQLPYDSTMTGAEYSSKVSTQQEPFILKMNLVGTGTKLVTYQNMFGARVSANLPTIKIDVSEYLVDKNTGKIYVAHYPIGESWSKSTAAGGQIYSQTDMRKLTKNGVRAFVRDACIYNAEKMNKYADPVGYQRYIDLYTGNFKKLDESILGIAENVPYLGIGVKENKIIKFFENSPMKADGANLDDTLISINGESVRTENELGLILKKYKAGDKLNVKVLRQGTEVNLSVTTGRRLLNNMILDEI